jgi:D-arabinose 5-phosphate isomerase GutQ
MDHHPIQNSEVYLIRPQHERKSVPPPSPPSPCETRPLSPVEDAECLLSTPPSLPDANSTTAKRLQTAIHVLGTEATALSHVTRLYETDPAARDGFSRAVHAIRSSISPSHPMRRPGKLVISGVGKSGHIAKKLVATMNSLRIGATFLHPTEALHGDLGTVAEEDVLMLITFSGKTPELMQLVPYLPRGGKCIILTSHTHPENCPLVRQRWDIAFEERERDWVRRGAYNGGGGGGGFAAGGMSGDEAKNTILLPAPIHEAESASFGVSAPTTSTTVALAIGDALAIAISDELHGDSVAEVFSRFHPGGAIGQASRSGSVASVRPSPSRMDSFGTIPTAPSSPTRRSVAEPEPKHERRKTVGDLARRWEDIPDVIVVGGNGESLEKLNAAHVLVAGYASTSGWVRVGNGAVCTPRGIKCLRPEDMNTPARDIANLVVPQAEWFKLDSRSSLDEAVAAARGGGTDSVVGVVDGGGRVVGVLDVEALRKAVDGRA